jgi:cobalt-zinc-cadmium efflux system membrane fusion protein
MRTVPVRLRGRAARLVALAALGGALAMLVAEAVGQVPAPGVTAGAARLDAEATRTLTLRAAQLRLVALAPVELRTFHDERVAFGQIALNDDLTTPVFPPYAGRVTRLYPRPGDVVARGDLLFEIDSPDLVQAEAALINAAGALTKARSQLDLTDRTLARQRALWRVQAAPLKDVEQAEADQRSAESDARAAVGALAAARDAVRIFGKADAQIAQIESQRRTDPTMPVYAPFAGTVIARKAGPGQLVQPSNADPVYLIADVSTVWLVANVAELDVSAIHLGDAVRVAIAAYPDETFRARITNIGASIDPVTRRVSVRSEVETHGRALKPQMFASFRITADAALPAPEPAVPATAVVRDGDASVVWVARGPNRFEACRVERGIEQGGMVQILSGLAAGETIVAQGAVFLSNALEVGVR